MIHTPSSEESTVYIFFSGTIGSQAYESLMDLMIKCVDQRVDHIYLLISTPGGNVTDGIKLHNSLRALPIKLTTHNIGDVDSIGNVLFMAGERRYACANARFMFHGVTRNFSQPITDLNAQAVRWALAAITADEQRISSIIQRCSNLNEAQIAAFFQEGYRMDALEALSVGIVQEIKDIEIPGFSTVINLSFED